MRPSILAFCLSASALAPAVACPSLAAQTSDFFQARILPRDRSVNLQLNSNGKDIDWQITPHGVPTPINKDELLLTYSIFKIGYLHYNPLTFRLEASVKDFDDPSQAVLQKLIDAITSTAGTLASAKAEAAKVKTGSDSTTSENASRLSLSLKDYENANILIQNFEKQNNKPQDTHSPKALDDLIMQQADLAARVAQLEATQTRLKARQAITDAITIMINGNDGGITGADARLKEIRLHIVEWPHIIDTAWGVPGTTGSAVISAAIAKMADESVNLGNLTKDLQRTLKDSKEASFATGDEIRLLNHLDTLIAQVNASEKAVTDLIATLREDQEPVHWTIDDPSVFLIGTIVTPTLSTGKEVTVTVTPLKLQVMDDGLNLEEQKAITATFKARRYRALMPEVGVGAVMGYIDRPKYGTGLDANGRTIVALSSTDHVSVDPAIIVNFVCHCNAGGIAPMLQVGAATSKDLPALLLGGGFRLFGLGKGDIGIGGGLLLGWHKDLQKLKVGSSVDGTAEIDADLAYLSTPTAASYIALQYKF